MSHRATWVNQEAEGVGDHGLHEGLAAELAGLRLASLGYKDVSHCLVPALGVTGQGNSGLESKSSIKEVVWGPGFRWVDLHMKCTPVGRVYYV